MASLELGGVEVVEKLGHKGLATRVGPCQLRLPGLGSPGVEGYEHLVEGCE